LKIKENNITITHPKLAKEWDYERNIIDIRCITYGMDRKVWWKCENEHTWNTSVCGRIKRGSGCQLCSFRKKCKNPPRGFNLAQSHPHLLKEWDYKKNTINQSNVLYAVCLLFTEY